MLKIVLNILLLMGIQSFRLGNLKPAKSNTGLVFEMYLANS